MISLAPRSTKNHELGFSFDSLSKEEGILSKSGSVTICVSGQSNNKELMVQCEKCEVWQHCPCIGLKVENIPKRYYCEVCHSTLEKTSKDTSEKPKHMDDVDNPNSKIADSKRPIKRRRKVLPLIVVEKNKQSVLSWDYEVDTSPERYVRGKINYPHANMSLSDMSKRVESIMEYLNKLKSKNQPNKYCLLSPNSPLTPVPLNCEETSTVLIETINQKILRFQKQFGKDCLTQLLDTA
ncbi:hypothetical protein BY458DRAFT_491566 [Sporodiniella umbellata]|nr:hypothetical protein BY458DRAFT_491566 [Sporodiniella umbellata]